MFQARFVGKNLTHVLYSVTVLPTNHAVNEIRWKNNAQPDRMQTII
jgi:hypothetical protein